MSEIFSDSDERLGEQKGTYYDEMVEKFNASFRIVLPSISKSTLSENIQ